MNQIHESPPFQRSYRWKVRHQPEYVEKIDEWSKVLLSAERPELLGEPKLGRLKGVFGIRLGHDSRLLFAVDRETDPPTVVLFRCCTHKEVYR